MNRLLPTAFVLLLVLCIPAGIAHASTRPAADRPNFVIVVAEGLSWAGTSVAMDPAHAESRSAFAVTPNLERLAASGIRFTDGYAASPRCTPSRAALLTGVSPAKLGMTFVGRGRNNRVGADVRLIPPTFTSELPQSTTTYAEVLRDHGYATAHF
ncbi:MAG: sulfatase-like hydrolase/transferase, partial [Planctomycetota bacterium]